MDSNGYHGCFASLCRGAEIGLVVGVATAGSSDGMHSLVASS